MASVALATVLLGAVPFKEGNVNDTFRGQVLTEDKAVRQSIIKDLDVIQLSNELLAHALARHVGLPIPDCFLGMVRPGVLAVTKGPQLDDGSRLVFVSADVKVPNLTYRILTTDPIGLAALLADVTGWSELGRLYAFDAWIANTDRHQGNLLFGSPSEAWLIDHGHCFTGPTWKPTDLDPACDVPNRLADWLTPCLTGDQKVQRRGEALQLSASLAGFSAEDATKSCRVGDLLPVEFVDALKGFVERRVATVPVNACRALGVPTMI